MVSMFQTLTKLTMSDSLMVTLIGLLVVFAVLAIIIVLIEFLHAALKDRKKAPVSDAPVAEAKKEPEQRISAGVMAEVPEAADAEKDGDFIAAVSAAITCVTGNSNFKIKSIKKG